MSTAILPFAMWSSGTNQNSIPANDNSLRNQILNGMVISQSTTAQPGSPAQGDIYIIASTHTGSQWAGFTPKDLAIYSSGTWYAYAPVEGVVVNVAGTLYEYVSGSWTVVSAGGGTAGGANTQVQYNNSGAFAGASGFTYASSTLSVPNITLTGLALTAASATGGAGIRLPHGTAPTSPTNGDIWTTTAGFYARINGSTIGPFAAGFSNPMTTAGDIIYGGASGAPTRLAAGTDGYVLTLVSGNPSWATAGGGGGLTNISEALNTASPNVTNNVESLTVTGGTTRTDLALIPKGSTGAVLTAVPDGTSTGGNPRGTRAFDFQLVRGAAEQVASGQESIVIGARNTASGAASVAIGDTNTSSNPYATAFGFTNTASGYGASCLGGSNSTADGQRSTTVGGQYLSTKGITGLLAFGTAGQTVANAGKRQAELYAWASNTADGTATKMGTDGTAGGSDNQAILNNDSGMTIQGQVFARQGATGDAKGWSFSAVVKRGANAAATALVGSATVTVIGADAGASAWALAIIADTANGGLSLEVTGEAAKTITWTGSAMASFVSA